MPGTAIVAIHTEEGFVIAADGRKKWGEEIVTEKEQKIYPIQREWDKLAYALAGITTLPKSENADEILFDFRQKVRDAFSVLQGKQPLSFGEFVNRLAGLINGSLEALRTEHPDVPFPDPGGSGLIAHLLLVGFYNQNPVVGKITLLHRSQNLARTPKTEAYESYPGKWTAMMPRRLGESLQRADDERLSTYLTEPLRKMFAEEQMNLLEAQGAALTCIKACTDPLASQIDPDSQTVGGYIHLATITESAGFSWVIRPKGEVP